MSFIKDFIKSKKNSQTVFSFSDLSQSVTGYTGSKLRSALKYALSRGDIFRITKGVYSLSKDYNHWEFANKFRSPSYISLYSVFQKGGVVFQPYPAVYVISNRSQKFEIEGQTYIYRKIKDSILLNPLGIKNEEGVNVAGIERAICDKLYLDGEEYFDNLRNIDWDLVKKINRELYGENKLILNFINKNNQ